MHGGCERCGHLAVRREVDLDERRSAGARPPRRCIGRTRARGRRCAGTAVRSASASLAKSGVARSTPGARAAVRVLHVAQHAVAAVVEDQQDQAGSLLGEREQLAEVHRQAAVTGDHDSGGRPGGRARPRCPCRGPARCRRRGGRRCRAGRRSPATGCPRLLEAMVTSRAIDRRAGQRGPERVADCGVGAEAVRGGACAPRRGPRAPAPCHPARRGRASGRWSMTAPRNAVAVADAGRTLAG